MLTGDYRNTLDEKGRIMFPSKLRSDLPQSSLILTQGLDTCLWLFTAKEWELLSNKIMENASAISPRYDRSAWCQAQDRAKYFPCRKTVDVWPGSHDPLMTCGPGAYILSKSLPCVKNLEMLFYTISLRMPGIRS